MNKHTAAPWHAVELEDGTVRICGDSKYAVAVCNTRNPFCPEQLANAKLIAAAPEMLDIIKEIRTAVFLDTAVPEVVRIDNFLEKMKQETAND